MMLAGLGLLGYSLAAYLGLVPGGYTSVPHPAAFSGTEERSARLEARPEVLAAPAEPIVQPPAPLPAAPSASGKLNPADAADRRMASVAARPGQPTRLLLPSIQVEAEVKPGGVVIGADGEPEWETLPFVATTYPLLGLVGSPGNAVVSGHVVTLREGNVFRDLYRVGLGDPIEVFTENSRFTYTVDEIKLVPPTAVDALEPSEDARLTVITCGGTFDPRSRTFSERLIVVGKLTAGERL